MTTTLYVKRNWRWVIAGLAGETKSFLDKLATAQSMKFVLDDMQEVTMDVPSDNIEIYTLATSDNSPFVTHSKRLVFGLRREELVLGTPLWPYDDAIVATGPWNCRFSGIVTITQDQATSDEPITHLTGNDAWGWAKSLPVLNPDGSLPGQKGVTYTGHTGDYIAKDIITNAYGWITTQFGGHGTWPWNGLSATEANLFIDISSGHFDTTESIPIITFQQGASVADAWQQLCQTGAIDIVLTPVYDGDNSGRIAVMNVFNQAGQDQKNAVFGWDVFPNNLVGIDILRDGTQTENWVQFYAGGLAALFASSPPSSEFPVGYHDGSIGQFGPYFAQKNISGPSDTTSVELLALAEVALRKNGKTTLTVDPAPEIAPDPFIDWFLGDTVYVWAGRNMKEGISADSVPGNSLRQPIKSIPVGDPAVSPWRVYGFQIDLANDLTETVTNLLLTDPNTQSF